MPSTTPAPTPTAPAPTAPTPTAPTPAAPTPVTPAPTPAAPVVRADVVATSDPARFGTCRAARSQPPTPEDGSMVTEYGLVAVVGATIAALVVRWASSGAISDLLTWVLGRVRDLLGA